MLNKIDHVGIAVPNLQEALAALKFLGSGDVHYEEVEDQGVRVACIPLRDCNVELLEPTSPDSAVGKFLAKRGSGVHHLAFAVDDVAARLDELAAQGVQLIDKTPREGANGKQIAFLHPKSTGGILIELCSQP